MSDLKAFHEQVKRGDLDGVRTALADEPDLINRRNDAGQNAFLLAKYYRQGAVAEFLLSLNPTLDIFDASVAGIRELVENELAKNPSLLESHNPDGWTPLHLAAFFGHPDLAAALLNRGTPVDIRSTNAMENTPLHAAVAGNQVATVRLLLEQDAHVDARQQGGWTALHGAAQAGAREMVELLITAGADAGARADNNQTPLDLALLKGHQEVASLLESLGAQLH
jgi:ankyrin repeat protein